jgi:hypothetical protein
MSNVYKIRPFGLLGRQYTVNKQGFIYYWLAWAFVVIFIAVFVAVAMALGPKPMTVPILLGLSVPGLLATWYPLMLAIRHSVPEDEAEQ